MNYAGKFGSGASDSFSSAGLSLDSLAHDGGSGTVTIPDAHLLFSGNYSRSGADLIVSDQLHRVVVPNYFQGDKRPALVSPDGAPLDASVIEAMTGHVQYAQAASSAAAAAAKVVGHVVKMTGSASVVRNGVTITLNNGDTVLQNDVVQTGSGSSVGLVMIDGTTFNLSAGARLMLNDLTYDASSTSNSSLFTLVQGAASFVAGQVAKTGDMKVGTPVATMGIRGTAVILDISSVDGKVSISVIDQRDGQVHSVQVYNSRGVLIGTVTSNGSALTLTPIANFEVIAQESNKTVAQIQQEFNTFNEALRLYEIQKAIDPSLPQHTENNANPRQYASLGSAPADSPQTVFQTPTGTGTPGASPGTVTQIIDFTPPPGGTGPSGSPTPHAVPTPLQVVVQSAQLPFVVNPSTVPQISSDPGNHFGPVMSASGDVVYDPDGVIYFYDRETNTTSRVTPENDGFSYSGQTISSDGRYLVYQGTNGTDTFVYVYGTDPSDPAHYHQQIQLVAGTSPAISGDGNTILVEHGGSSIGIYNLQGDLQGTITAAAAGATGTVWKPAISADGHVMAFWTSDGTTAGGAGHLFVYDVTIGTVTEIASTATDAGTSAASFSADGRYVTYQSDAPGGHSEIYLYDLSTGVVVFHTANTAGASYNPVLSPDGHFIVFASDAHLVPGDTNAFTDIYTVDVTNPLDPVYRLVSVRPDGTPGDADSNLGAAISAGGKFVVFGTRASNFSNDPDGGDGDIFISDPSSGRNTIIYETANSPSVLHAQGVIGLTGDRSGTLSISVSDNSGRFTAGFDANGNIVWNFNEARSDFDSLAYGQDSSQQFTITLTAGGKTTTIPVNVTVHNGVQPIVTAVDAAPGAAPITLAQGTEDTSYTITAAALLAGAGDIDTPLSLLSITDVSIRSGGGSLHHDENGNWTYTPAAGFNGPVVFDYTVSDDSRTASSTASLNVASVNDVATITGQATAGIAEDVSTIVSGTLTVHDADSGEAVFQTVPATQLAGTYGNFTFNSNTGAWAYAPVLGQTNGLAAGQVAHDTLTVVSADGTASQLIDVTITGTNDGPVLAAGSVTSGSLQVQAHGGGSSTLTPGAAALLASGPGLISGLEGEAGYGTLALSHGDDNSSGPIDITSVFGSSGINFFGHNYTSIYINNNGNITFSAPTGQFTPSRIDAGLGNPIIAAFWADVDTRAAGNVYYDLDATDGVMTITWDHVGYFSNHADRLNSFQIMLVNEGYGNFDIVYRFADIQWTTGDLSGGAPARAGYSAGDGSHYFELPQSGNVSALLSLPATLGNTSVAGVDQFDVRNGAVEPSALTATGMINFSDADFNDIHTVASVTYTGGGDALGTLTLVKVSDSTGTGTGGQFAWSYIADPETVRNALGNESKVETFEVVISDGHGGTISQTVSVTLTETGNHAPVATAVTLAAGTEDTPYIIDPAWLLAGVTDEDGQPLSIAALSIASGGGTIVRNDNGTWSYTPTANYNGPVSFSYTASDGTLTSVSTASLTLAAVNDAPDFTGHSVGTDYTGTPVAIATGVSASDIDSADYAGGSLTATVTAGGQEGDTLSLAESEYIHFAVSGNIVSFDADGDDGPGGFVDIGTLTNNFNSLTIALNANATDEAVARLAQAIQFENSKPHAVASGTRTVTFTLDDGGGTANGGHNTDFLTAMVNVPAVSRDATFGGDFTGEVTEDDTTIPSGSIHGHDVDNGTLTVQDVDDGEAYFQPIDPDSLELVGEYGNFTFDHTSGEWTYTLVHERVNGLAEGEFQYDTLTVASVDGTTQDITVTVRGANEAPVFAGTNLAATFRPGEGAVSVVNDVSVSDPDSDDYDGGSLTATVWDSHSGDRLSVAGTAFISVAAVASGHVVMFDADGDGDTGNAVSIGSLNGSGDSLTVYLNGNATDDAVDALAEAIRFENNNSYPDTGPRTVNFQLSDGYSSDRFEATVDVAAPSSNDAPVAENDSFNVRPDYLGIASTLILNDSDPDEDSFVISGAGYLESPATLGDGTFTVQGQYGTLRIFATEHSSVDFGGFVDLHVNAGDFIYAINQDINGDPIPGTPIYDLQPGQTLSEEFTYTISDRYGTISSPATVTVTFEPSLVDLDVRTAEGYDTTTLWNDLNDGAITAISSTHITVANGDRTIEIDAKGLTFIGLDEGGYVLTGGLIKGFHVSDSSGDLFDAVRYNLPAAVFDEAVASSGPTVFNGMLAEYGYDSHGSAGDDVLQGGELTDYFDTGGGADTVFAGDGNDIITVLDNAAWNIDGGAGVDTLKLAGAFDLSAGPEGQNLTSIEIIDLNKTDTNAILIEPEGLFQINADHVVRILGNGNDNVVLASAYPGHPAGQWVLAQSGTPYQGDSATAGVSFDMYEYKDGEVTLGTLYVEQGVTVASGPVAVNETLSGDLAGFSYNAGNGHWYAINTNSLSWTQARAEALAAGGYLATITSSAENDFVATLLGNYTGTHGLANSYAYVGGSDIGAEGAWLWMDGPEANQQFWQGGTSGSAANGSYANWQRSSSSPVLVEPNGGTSENYAYIRGGGGWVDYSGDAAADLLSVIELSFVEDHVSIIPAGFLLGNDNGASLSINGFGAGSETSATTAQGGTVELLENGNIRYTPAADYNGTDSFTYTVRDAGGLVSNVATVTFIVAPEHPGVTPTVTGDMSIVAVTGGYEVALTVADLNATDPDTSAADLVFTVAHLDHGRLAFGEDRLLLGEGETFTLADVQAGRVYYQSVGTYVGQDHITLGLSDDIHGMTTAIMGVTVVDAQFTVLTAGGYDFNTDDPISAMGRGYVDSFISDTFTIRDEISNREFIFSGSDFMFYREGDAFTSGTITGILERNLTTHEDIASFDVNVSAATWYAAAFAAAHGDSAPFEALTGSWTFNFIGNAGADHFGTANANDIFTGRAGDDTLDGEAGYDRASYGGNAGGVGVLLANGVVYELGPGPNPVIVGMDTLRSIEMVTGSNYIDLFDATGFGTIGSNVGSSADRFFNEFEGRGGDDIIFGNGQTRVSYYHATSGVTVTFTPNSWTSTAGGGSGTQTGDVSVGNDQFSGVNQVRGSFFGDTFTGSTNPFGTSENFEGLGGGDAIDGGGGLDRAVYAREEAGLAFNMAAGTVLRVSDNSNTGDTLRSIEAIWGTDSADTYDATNFSTVSINAGSVPTSASNPAATNFNDFEGGGGDDTVIGNGNTNVSFSHATAGVVVTLGTDGSGNADGDASVGHDTFIGNAAGGVTRVHGSDFNDILTGNGANNVLEGDGGNDVLDGRGGDNALRGGSGADIFVYAGTGNDLISDFGRFDGDRIDLRAFASIHSMNDLSVSAGAVNGVANSTIITFGATTLSLQGYDSVAHPLQASDFIFAGQVAVTVQTAEGYDFGTLYDDLANSSFLNMPDRIFAVDAARGISFELIGTGLAIDAETHQWTAGAITEINILDTIHPADPAQRTQDHVLANTNGWNISAPTLYDAIHSYASGDPAGLAALNGIFNAPSYSVVGGGDGISRTTTNVLFGGDLADAFRGASASFGSSTVDYSHATSSVSVNLLTGFTAGVAAAGDTFVSIDSLRGSDFNDTLVGGAGWNRLEGGLGDDTLDGGGGINVLSYEHAVPGAGNLGVTVDLRIAGPQDTIRAGVDTLSNFQIIIGSAGNDTLIGDGINNLLLGGAGADDLRGGGGIDGVDYEDALTGVTVSLADSSLNTGEAAGDTFDSIENVSGSQFNDVLIGNSGNNQFWGFDGNDTFVFNATTGSGQDTISDFVQGRDHIQLDYLAFIPGDSASFNAWLATHVTQQSFGVLIDLNVDGQHAGQDTIRISSFPNVVLTMNDFILHPSGG